jgi:hypothetical protein
MRDWEEQNSKNEDKMVLMEEKQTGTEAEKLNDI